MRSPGIRVVSIDPEGMENTCTTNALSRMVSARAATTITNSSRQKDRFRRCFGCRGPSASSDACLAPVSASACASKSAPGSEDISRPACSDALAFARTGASSGRLAASAGRVLPALLDPRGLAAQVAEVVELGAADPAAGDGLDLVDRRAVHREGALDADAVAHLAHGEGLTQAAALAPDHDTLEDLNAGAVALRHLDVHLEGVTRAETRNVIPELCLLKLGDRGVHDGCFLSPGRNARQRASGWKPALAREHPGRVNARTGSALQCAIFCVSTGKPASASTWRSRLSNPSAADASRRIRSGRLGG